MSKIRDLIEEKILPQVQKPARYTNNELGSIHKDQASAKATLALGFPDLYEIGMSNLGIQILYSLVNKNPDYCCERAFSPAADMEEKLLEHELPLFSLESYSPLNTFDLVGISLQHELTYTNFLNMLKLGQIPLLSKDRQAGDPYVFVGGHCAFNPAPVADFIDFAVVGEGEEIIMEIMEFVKNNKALPRAEFLKNIAQVKGIYVPILNNSAQRRYIKDLDSIPLPDQPLIPFIETVHDRANVEIMRGCGRACRFCQAGYATLPKREFSKAKILERAEVLLKHTGYDELSLTSLSSGDHSQIEGLCLELINKYAKQKINIALPSLRVDSFSDEVAKAIQSVRHSGLTLAPEAGTQRLRDVVNKKINEVEILDSIKKAVATKTNSIKLYFMIGLPTETQADLDGIIDLAEKIKPILKAHRRTNCTFNVSNFVPKPHTPFQWARQDPMDEFKEKQQYIKSKLIGKQIKLRFHDTELSYLEGIFARGDRALGKVLLSAFNNGARFDSWYEHFDLSIWNKALADNNSRPEDYFRERQKDENLPWDVIDTGVQKKNLRKEYEKALA